MISSELRAAIIFSVLLVLLYLAGSLFPGSLDWGFHFLGFLPWQYTILYVAAILWLLFFVVKGNPDELFDALGKKMNTSPLQLMSGIVFLIVCSAFLLRVRAPLLGDSFYLMKNYHEAAEGTVPLYPRDEPLSTYYYAMLLRSFGFSSYEKFLDGFLIADILVGIGFIANVFFITKTAFTEARQRILAMMFLLAPAYMQLFFGYVETYAVLLFAVSLYINVSVLCLHRKAPFWLVPTVFLFMALTHYLSTLLIFSLLYLAYTEVKSKRAGQVVAGFGVLALFCIGLLVAIDFDIARFSSSVPYSHFLSVAETSDPIESYAQAYTMFSLFHLIDIANLVILLAAAPLFILSLCVRRDKRALVSSSLARFLTAAIIPAGCLLFVVKFDLGAARDWDVLSPYFFLVAFLASHLWFRQAGLHTVRSYVLLLFLTLTNSFVFAFLNSDADPSLRRFASFFDRRTLSQNGYYGASLQLALYYHQVEDLNEPVRIWRAYTASFPDDARGYGNIINNLSMPGKETDILRTYEQWYARDPGNASMREQFERFCIGAGNRFFAKGEFSSAALFYQKAVQLDSSNARAFNNLGSVLAEERNYNAAIAMFEKAIALDSAYSDAFYNLGYAYIDSGSRGKGTEYLRRAARLGNERAQEDLQKQKLAW